MLRFAAVLVLPATWLFSPQSGRATELPVKVQKAFQINCEALNGLQISGDIKTQLSMSTDEAAPFLGPWIQNPEQIQQTLEFVIRTDGLRFYEQLTIPPDDTEQGSQRSETAFDGEKFRTGFTHGTVHLQQGFLTIQSLKKHDTSHIVSADLRYLKETGFIFSSTIAGLPHGIRFITPLDSAHGKIVECQAVQHGGRELLEIVMLSPEPWAGGRTESVENGPQSESIPAESTEFLIETAKQKRSLVGKTRTTRWHLDPELNYAVTEKWISRDNGDLIQHTKYHNHQQIDDTPLWLPGRCEIIAYAWPMSPALVSPTPILVTDVTRTETSRPALSEADFRFSYDMPGTRVVDYTHPNAADGQGYETRIPDDEESDTAVAAALEEDSPRTGVMPWPTLLTANGGVLLALLIAFRFWKRHRSATD